MTANNNVHINLNIASDALESTVNELTETQDELSKVKNELAQVKADLNRRDKIRERDFDYLIREYAYNIWCKNCHEFEGNESYNLRCQGAADAIREVLITMYNRDVNAYNASDLNHLLIEVSECETSDCKPIMYIHWDADEPTFHSFTAKVYVK